MIEVLKVLCFFLLLYFCFAIGYLVAWPLGKWVQSGYRGKPDFGMLNGGKPR